MQKCQLVTLVVRDEAVRAVAVSAQILRGGGGVSVSGPPRAVTVAIEARLRGAVAALALCLPSVRVQIGLADADPDEAGPLAFASCLAVLAAGGVVPASVVQRLPFASLAADGAVAAVAGAAKAAAVAAGRGLGLICAASHAGVGRAAGCASVVAAGDLLAIISALRELTPGSWLAEPAPPRRVTGMAENQAASPASDWDAKLQRFWTRLLDDGTQAEPQSREAEPQAAPATPARPFGSEGPVGHRARMRDRVVDRGTDSLADYELLEMLLFLAFKSGDTKPLAKRLINRFGSFANVLSAPQQQLLATHGLGRHSVVALLLVRAAAVRLARGELTDQPILNDWDRLMGYLTTVLARERVEHFRILFLDNRNRLLADEAQARGTVNHTPVYPREVVKRALELHATAIILVHNHPSGDPTPSVDDIAMTEAIGRAAGVLEVVLHDHVIVGNGRWTSFRKQGLL